jgi:hypothetical protein
MDKSQAPTPPPHESPSRNKCEPHATTSNEESYMMWRFIKYSLIAIPLIVVVLVGLLIAYMEIGNNRVKYWDKKIEVMCKERFQENKAYKVFERTELPSSYLNEHGMYREIPPIPFNDYKPKDHETLFRRIKVIEVVRDAYPRVAVYAVQVYRRSDSKVLGETYMIARSGAGGVIELGYMNRHRCPDDYSDRYMAVEMFTNLTTKQAGIGAN